MFNLTWGLRPVLFYVGNFPVQSYPVFLFLAVAVGLLIYVLQLKEDGVKSPNALFIAIFAVVGGTIGSKVPIMIMYWKQINSDPATFNILLSGRTVIGGLVGGWMGTFIAKRLFKIKERMGNQLAIPVAVGMAIGRIGCLLRGCCYGEATGVNFGLDFGDHILRHPTQLYELFFDISLAIYPYFRKKKGVKPGELFRLFLNYYLGFRFLIEFIRVEKVSFVFLTDFQLLCIISMFFINRHFIFSLFKRKDLREYEQS